MGKKRKNSILVGIFAIVIVLYSKNNIVLAANIVNPNQVYTYVQMTKDIKALANKYPDLIEYKSLGKSSFGRELWAVKLGNGDATVFINAAHHAREWATTNVVMSMIDQYAQADTNGQSIQGFDVKGLLKNTTVWFVPMVNPDGVTLQQFGLSGFPQSTHSNLVKYNLGSTNFGRWKADGYGIDPNRQYPADWANIILSPSGPSYSHYKGIRPLQTPENKMIADFTYQINPEIAVAYHSTGKIIYWNFHNKPENVTRDKRIAEQISAITGYSLVAPIANPSGGGYTDWFIQEFGRPGFTPEICSYTSESQYALDHNAILSCVNGALDRNRPVGLLIADEGYKLWAAKTKQINQTITLLESTPIYHQPLTSTRVSAISAQNVVAFQQQGEWYRINTWLGPKWIKPTNMILGNVNKIDETITIVESVHLYEYPAEVGKRNDRVSPQRVQAFEEWNGWYRINTWLGPKWIKGSETIVGEINKVNETLTIVEAIYLYDFPSENNKRTSRVSPQRVQAFEEWNGWYRINTWLGPKWIKGSEVISGVINQVNETLTIVESIHLYDHPLEQSIRTNRVSPQRVQAFEEWNGWYRINTWLGPKWIKGKEVLLGEVNKVDQTLTFVENTYLYDQPLEQAKTSKRVTPQRVQAFAEWNGWYQINTWLGPKWINTENVIIGAVNQITETIVLVEETYLYDQPFESRKRSDRLLPQSVQAMAEWNGWYQINTWLGPKWIKPVATS